MTNEEYAARQKSQNNNQPKPAKVHPAMADADLPRIAGITDKPEEIGGRTITPKQVEEAIIKVLVSITSINYDDVFSVRVLQNKDGHAPDIILQVKERAINKQQHNPDSWITTSTAGMKIDRAFTDAMMYTFFTSEEDIVPRKIKFKDQRLVEFKLDTEVVAALLCDVAYDDMFLRVDPLPLSKKDTRKNKRLCGLLVRYSTYGKGKGFSRESIVKYFED